METVFTGLAEQIPTAVLLVVFVLVWTDRLHKWQEKIEAAKERRDEINRQFWQQSLNNIVSGQATIIAGQNEIRCHQEEHDKWAREEAAKTRPVPRRRAP